MLLAIKNPTTLKGLYQTPDRIEEMQNLCLQFKQCCIKYFEDEECILALEWMANDDTTNEVQLLNKLNTLEQFNPQTYPENLSSKAYWSNFSDTLSMELERNMRKNVNFVRIFTIDGLAYYLLPRDFIYISNPSYDTCLRSENLILKYDTSSAATDRVKDLWRDLIKANYIKYKPKSTFEICNGWLKLKNVINAELLSDTLIPHYKNTLSNCNQTEICLNVRTIKAINTSNGKLNNDSLGLDNIGVSYNIAEYASQEQIRHLQKYFPNFKK